MVTPKIRFLFASGLGRCEEADAHPENGVPGGKVSGGHTAGCITQGGTMRKDREKIQWRPGPPRRCRSRIKDTIQQEAVLAQEEDLTQILPTKSPGALKTKLKDETHHLFHKSLPTAPS